MRSLTMLIDPDGYEKHRTLADFAHNLVGVCWLDPALRHQLDEAWGWDFAAHAPEPAPPKSVITVF